MKIHPIYISILIGLIPVLSSCNKAVEVSPPTNELVSQSVFAQNSTAASAVSAIYQQMSVPSSIGGGQDGISDYAGLSADELTLSDQNPGDVALAPCYSNSFSETSAQPSIWTNLYKELYQANAAITGLTASSGVSPAMKNQLLGESKFTRALIMFYLTNLYGPIPLVTSTNYASNALLPRSPQSDVYNQIVSDLVDATNKLSDNYLTPSGTVTTERVRPNKIAAETLLARVYLYMKKYSLAEQCADSVISNSNYTLEALNNVFLIGSREAIWQLELPVTNLGNTPDGDFFLFNLTGGINSSWPVSLSRNLFNSFEAGDQRKTSWTGSYVGSDGTTYYYPYKYKQGNTGNPPVEYPVVLRLGEVYLIRAEARAQQQNLSGAASDLDMIRTRAGLPNTTAVSQAELLTTIMNERRHELFTEYGHRWLDLKRTGQVDGVMSVVTPQKGGTWKPTDALYPIPFGDIQYDPHLTQNPGY